MFESGKNGVKQKNKSALPSPRSALLSLPNRVCFVPVFPSDNLFSRRIGRFRLRARLRAQAVSFLFLSQYDPSDRRNFPCV